MPKRGGRRKKSRTHNADPENAAGTLANSEASKIPKSLVVSAHIALFALDEFLGGWYTAFFFSPHNFTSCAVFVRGCFFLFPSLFCVFTNTRFVVANVILSSLISFKMFVRS
jgi:hypothetical protein